jgi:hypothetical protein
VPSPLILLSLWFATDVVFCACFHLAVKYGRDDEWEAAERKDELEWMRSQLAAATL